MRTAKRALIYILHGQTLTDEMLSTALIHVENLLNSRPLTAVGTDPRSPEPLTPHHLLLGRANPNLPPDVFGEREVSSRKKWRATQTLIDHFWNRWMREFVPGLAGRQKWWENQRNLKNGDIVMIINPQNACGTWPIGRVYRTIDGPDGVVRSVWI